MSTDRQPPFGVYIVHNFLNDRQCNDWVAQAERKKHSWLQVVDTKNSTQDKIIQKPDPARVTQKVELEELQEKINAAMGHAVVDKIEPVIKQKIAWFENSTLLRYTTGGKYLRHADADLYDREHKAFFKCMDRDFSMLLYLNDEYTGGSINFTRFNYCYRPKKGDLLFFPSDHRYLHQAETVTSGVRYAVVSWAAVENAPRVLTEPPIGFCVPARTEPRHTS